jgi:hypothetical protein
MGNLEELTISGKIGWHLFFLFKCEIKWLLRWKVVKQIGHWIDIYTIYYILYIKIIRIITFYNK